MDGNKPIIISRHAALRMKQRGATTEEVKRAIRAEPRQSAQRGKWHTRHAFSYNAVSPVNGRHYAYKTVDVVFADDPASITVVTVKVYYHN